MEANQLGNILTDLEKHIFCIINSEGIAEASLSTEYTTADKNEHTLKTKRSKWIQLKTN